MDGDQLRTAFTRYFVERDHVALSAASLVPVDPTVMFTIAGMVQFKPYFTGEQPPPFPRATSIQPCFRTNDIEIIGTTARHTTLFEMLGNFSFGDYFKERAIPLAWEFVTEVLGFESDRLWITVHESDDDAAGIWQEAARVPADRIQKMGADNFWEMGEVGPCGPCSEIYFDRGDEFGPGGGPANDDSDRYSEIWNLVFMQFERAADGSMEELPKKNIDTGAGLERILMLLQGVDSVFATDVLAPIVERAASATKTPLGRDHQSDVALRILADHARSAAFLVADGIVPSNEGRGYVLRRMIRRAALRAYQLGTTDVVLPAIAESVATTLGPAYPRLTRDLELVCQVVAHEEEAFRRNLRAGFQLLEVELRDGVTTLPGEVAFRLHDTYGFPIDLTVEVAQSRGVDVDRAGFDQHMEEQRRRGRADARKALEHFGAGGRWRDILQGHGPTEFAGYEQVATDAEVLAVVPRDDAKDFVNVDGERAPDGAELVDVVLDRTPFYAEGGGQVGDTGTIRTPNGVVRVLDTTSADGVSVHTGFVAEGSLREGERALAAIDVERREAIRRNHTATHLLHAALRQVLGEHAKQQGSLVAPDRLRFDFSHFSALSDEELERVERIVSEQILDNDAVTTYETSREQADHLGAVAFFGDKYGESVRVVEAGPTSLELCGGTHVGALGAIGPFRILSESSIGANTRRIEATTGTRSIDEIRQMSDTLQRAATKLRTVPFDVADAVERLVERERGLEDELHKARTSSLREDARVLADQAQSGVVIARRDGVDPAQLRELALAVRSLDVESVALIGAPDAARVAIVVATRKDGDVDAREIAANAARAVGGGGGGSKELATAGGRDVGAIDTALEILRGAFDRA
ncbi:MAG: alanine--tRNA ligase [Acidimicrobiales bacterium]